MFSYSSHSVFQPYCRAHLNEICAFQESWFKQSDSQGYQRPHIAPIFRRIWNGSSLPTGQHQALLWARVLEAALWHSTEPSGDSSGAWNPFWIQVLYSTGVSMSYNSVDKILGSPKGKPVISHGNPKDGAPLDLYFIYNSY